MSEVKVQEKNHKLVFTFGNIGARDSLLAELSCNHPGAHMMKRRMKYLANWDGMINYCKKIGQSESYVAPAGFAKRVRKWAALNQIDLDWQVEDAREFVVPEFQQLCPLTLDQDQIPACTALLRERRCSIEFGTGSGKTLVSANAILCLEQAIGEHRALMIVPKLTLLYQTQKAFKEFIGPQVGIVGDGKFEWDHPVVVATADTASGGKQLKYSQEIRQWLRTIDLLILDEAHHTTSDRWQELIENCPAQRLWALSGKLTYTGHDQRHKQMALEGQFGVPVYSGYSRERTCDVTIVQHRHPLWARRFDSEGLVGQLTDGTHAIFRGPDGEWLQGTYHGLDVETNKVPSWMLKQDLKTGKWKPDRSMYGIYAGDPPQVIADLEREDVIYWTRHDVAIMEFEERNQWALELGRECARRKESFVVTVKRRKHLVRMLKWFRKAGIPVAELGGHLSGTRQSKEIKDLREKKVPGMVAILSTIGEGVDIADLRHIIKLDGMADEQTLEQLKGRLQRQAPGKIMGYLHVPYDEQHSALQKTRGTVVNYYRKKGLTVKEVTHLGKPYVWEW